jgi:carboxypeptidase Q
MNDEPVRLDAVALGRTLDDVAEIGNRFCGTAGELAARDYALERLGALGLADVRLEPFPYLAYAPVEASCSIVSPARVELECNALEYTADADVEAEAVYIGGAEEEDFRRLDRLGVELAGKVVVAHSMFPFDLAPLLQERGIAAFVHVCEAPDGIVGTFTGALYPPPLSAPWTGRPTAYPGVTIGVAAGRALISTLTCGAPVTIRVAHRGRCEPRTASNVVAAIPGSGDGEVIVCAHYDSQADGPCVFDNGTGLASLFETARALRDSRPRRRIVLIAAAAEEIGLWGSTAYVHAHAVESDAVAGMVNLDGVASAYPAQRELWSADAGMIRFAVETAEAQGWKPDRVMHRRSTFGDHAPFADAGIPSCLIWRPDHPYYHSRGDVRSLVDEVAVAQTASVSATVAHRLAQGADVPGDTRRGWRDGSPH